MRLEPKFDGVGGNMKDLNIVAFRLIVGFCLVGLASCAVSPESTMSAPVPLRQPPCLNQWHLLKQRASAQMLVSLLIPVTVRRNSNPGGTGGFRAGCALEHCLPA